MTWKIGGCSSGLNTLHVLANSITITLLDENKTHKYNSIFGHVSSQRNKQRAYNIIVNNISLAFSEIR